MSDVINVTRHQRAGITWDAYHLRLPGVVWLARTAHLDLRGTYDRLFDSAMLAEAGIAMQVAESALVHNPREGTMRGLHYQRGHAVQAKLVTVISGQVLDCVVDLRADSSMHGMYLLRELNPGHALFVPEGFAHGYVTTQPHTMVYYAVNRPYDPEAATGVHFLHPHLGVKWPDGCVRVVSDTDYQRPIEPLPRIASLNPRLRGTPARVCRCGQLESLAAWKAGGRGCPRCSAVWPENLMPS